MGIRDIDFSLPAIHLPVRDYMLLFVNKIVMTCYCISFASQDGQIPLGVSCHYYFHILPPLLISYSFHNAGIACWFTHPRTPGPFQPSLSSTFLSDSVSVICSPETE